MPKCLVSAGAINALVDGSFRIAYTAALDNPVRNWGGDFTPNISVNVATNLVNWKTKIVADALAQGATILNSDVIIFGAPS